MMTDNTSILALCEKLLKCFEPPERITPSEWVLKYRRLSAEASSKRGGKFTFKSAPWQREVLDSILDRDTLGIVLMWPSQLAGKTETMNNLIGWSVHVDPCAMLVLQPNEKPMAEDWSKSKLAPMIRDTPCLHGLVAESKGRDSANTMLRKSFPGGFISIAGANSPASLASRSIRRVFFDEIDRYPDSVGSEGDPVALARKRTETFPDAFTMETSTPTVKGASRIERSFMATDQRKWFCPCPKCGHWQTLEWTQVDWSKHGTEESPVYVCSGEKGCVLSDDDRQAMIRAGEWRATAKFRGLRGYYLNGIYCLFPPFRSYKTRLQQMVAEFLRAKHSGIETFKVWVNTFKAETWEDPAEKPPSADEVFGQCSNYLEPMDDGSIKVPEGVLVVVAGADCQADRVELEFIGYGHGEQSWGLGNVVVAGSPELPETWERVDDELARKFVHPSGTALQCACALIDRGYKGKNVDDFTRPRNARKIYSCFGSATPGQPIASAPTRQGPRRTVAFRVGTDTAKSILYSRLRITRPGPRYMHFPQGFGYDMEWFTQLLSERLETKLEDGKTVRRWVKTRPRNEALDKRVYAQAALEILRPNFDAIARNMKVAVERPKDEYVLKPAQEIKPLRPVAVTAERRLTPRRAPSAGGWLNRF